MSRERWADHGGALLRARTSAHAPGEFVGQESFMRAGEIRSLVERARVGPGVSVLDLCCGASGATGCVVSDLGGSYLGVDASHHAIASAREQCGEIRCRFEVAEVPPVPAGPFDVVMLLETMLAFADKGPLLDGVAEVLSGGGRFAFTVEEGTALTEPERRAMPASDTVWPVPLPELLALMDHSGLQVHWIEECTRAHREVVDALVACFRADRSAIAEEIGAGPLADLVASHRLWSEWLGTGRVRKFAVVATPVGERRCRD